MIGTVLIAMACGFIGSIAAVVAMGTPLVVAIRSAVAAFVGAAVALALVVAVMAAAV